MKQNALSMVIYFVLIIGMLPTLFLLPHVEQYVEAVKDKEAIMVSGEPSEDKLYEAVRKSAEKRNIPPVNARIDRVWKAVPGLAGLEVDIEASVDRMRKRGVFEEHLLVFKEVQPEVTLSDLPPSPVYKGNEGKNKVAFLINVAWGNEYIPDILSTLKEHGVHASFSLEGRWARENIELARMIAQNGHDIGNHSYSHPDMTSLSKAEAKKEINRTNEVVEAVIGQRPVWFGPPSGAYNEVTIQAAAEEGMRTVLWTVDTIDWKKPKPDEMVQRVDRLIHPAAIVLMHPTESTRDGLDAMIEKIEAKQLGITSVSALLSESRRPQVAESFIRDDFYVDR
ncbi:polysaccharide deacetylase family protein [Aureibacillus halotolerans]|uniref:Putative sporulation protein (Polysaccharide deacetylase family) n=1 Tax=Aureibacillus halotolerans TaxID=1508390 RepID=A0A4R6U4I6_9BACI|nr:polysaccharide deacetylase family protein [Aureibacillus halotolerans]TDQ39693.1 putative sporulation protein (polysaccharide deacetylase family) [Aureibacillus halotolerans]